MKLHLGCGKTYIPGFVHVDLNEYPHIDVISDVRYLSMFDDDSVDLVYASHVLEHFGRHETESILQEWYRVLKSGGVLRVAVPDFEAVIKAYHRWHDMNLIMGLLYGGQDYPLNFHHVGFDYKYLENMLKRVGFKEVRRYDWQETIHRNIDDYSQSYLPHMDKENGLLMSLNIETVK